MSDNNKRVQERNELHKAVWAMANDLRGSVDGWDFKAYVLVLLFYRFISENLQNYIDQGEHEAGDPDFDYSKLSDDEAEQAKQDLVESKGFFILPSQLFCNVQKKAHEDSTNLNETLEAVFRAIEGSALGSPSEKDFKGLFADVDVNSPKLGNTVENRNKKLAKLLDAIADMKFGDYDNSAVDGAGDVYEYLMTMYAANAGKSGGEFFTPQEVSRLLTLIGLRGRTHINKVYDPACGSGSLLLQSAKILGDDGVKLGYYGQEINLTTYNLCRINMFLHGIGYDKFDIQLGDTLTDPKHWDEEPFDLIVSNPPYSIHWEGDSNPILINDERFSPAGVLAPKSKADLAFVMHCLSWLSNEGTAAIVCFPGVLYRGGAEKKIRKYLIDNNYIDAIIQMPDNLFFGTSIATCLMILRKNRTDGKVSFIDASSQFIKVTNSNQLTEDNIQQIYKWYMDREDVEYAVKLVDGKDISEQDYNLSVSTYVEKKDTTEKIDIDVLEQQIQETVKKEQELRDQIDKIVSDLRKDDKNE